MQSGHFFFGAAVAEHVAKTEKYGSALGYTTTPISPHTSKAKRNNKEIANLAINTVTPAIAERSEGFNSVFSVFSICF